LAQRWLFEVMDLCLQCKACKTECPSNVDLAKLKSEFLHAYYRHNARPTGQRVLSNVDRLFRWSAHVAPVGNRIARNRLARRIMEALVGVDRRRSLPRLHRVHFRKWFQRRLRSQARIPGSAHRVILFDDCFTNFTEPHIARAAVTVLEHAGYRVEITAGLCCGRPLISKGFLSEARDLARRQLGPLSEALIDGTPLLGLEPSCVVTLIDEWPELVPGAAARRVADAANLAVGWLVGQMKAGACHMNLPRRPGRILLHPHCHQRALGLANGSSQLLGMIPGLDVVTLDAGCCGMAGMFGYEKQHYDLSTRIASLQLLPALAAEPTAMVAAPGTSCRHQIDDLANRNAQHPMEVLASNLALQPEALSARH
jgi:Fe-S oxidoreductase